MLSRYSADPKHSGLIKELAFEFRDQGHKVSVATLLERKLKKPTQLNEEEGVEVLRIKTGNMFNDVSAIEKGITALTLPYLLRRSIHRFWTMRALRPMSMNQGYLGNSSMSNTKWYC